MRWLWLAATALLSMTLSSSAAPAFRVGVASSKITPSLQRRVWIAGYGMNRPAESVHDDLWARALVIERGRQRVALVALDLIGLSHLRTNQIRKQVTAVSAERVLIACSHTHSGPDTIGIWGPNQQTTGRDPEYMAKLMALVAATVDQAAASLRPARMFVGAATVPDGLLHNAREPIQDKLMTALRFVDDDDQTIATLLNYGGHPEVMTTPSRALSSDWVHYLRETVESEFGGTALFFNGALGGMVTPEVKANTFGECERVGKGVGRAAVKALKSAERINSPRLRYWRDQVSLELDNQNFIALADIGVLEKGLFDGRAVMTEVSRLDLGPVRMLSIPGEVLPRPWLDLKKRMKSRYPICIALGNDELGYILHPDDFGKELYRYEASMSVGPKTWPALLEAALGLLKKR